MAKSLVAAVCVVSLAAFLQWPPPDLSPEVKSWRNEGKYFNFHGHSIFYRDDAGDSDNGRKLVVLHGFPSSSYDWVKVWPGLKKDFSRVIAPDYLGFGFSDKPAAHEYSILAQADLVERLLMDLHVTHVHLLAHDYGDTVAQELLHRFNEREHSGSVQTTILSVCLTNGGIFPEKHQALLIQTIGAHPVFGPVISRFACYPLFAKNFGRTFGPHTQLTEKEMQDFWAIFSYKSGHLVTHGLLQYIKERREHRDRWVGALQKTTVPVHTIYGDEDAINPRPFVQYYKEIVPNPSLSVLEGIGHYPQYEAPGLLLEEYRRSMATLSDGHLATESNP